MCRTPVFATRTGVREVRKGELLESLLVEDVLQVLQGKSKLENGNVCDCCTTLECVNWSSEGAADHGRRSGSKG